MALVHNSRNDGFTLVELLVTIVVGSIVTLAATTVLLLGLQLNKSSSDTVSQQNTTRIMFSVMERMASEGNIGNAVSDAELNEDYNDESVNDWTVFDKDHNILFTYSRATQTLYSGDSNGTPLMEEIERFSVEQDGDLITLTVKTPDGEYTSSIYCRTVNTDFLEDFVTDEDIIPEVEDIPDPTVIPEKERNARIAFIQKLASQYPSTGEILDEEGSWLGFYATWFNSNWPIDTPWCACYVSWALDQISDHVNAPTDNPKWYANVDYFMLYLMTEKTDDAPQNIWKYSDSTKTADPAYIVDPDNYQTYYPLPGDLIFFDWTVDDAIDPAHVGVVLTEKNGYIYTIEGNSNNRVAVRRYLKTDPRILGYGVLDWVETETE